MKNKERYDFCGYATKNDLLCTDGRTIRKDAFKDCDGKTVPLVWNHRHDDPEMVLGHAMLQNRPDGVYMYGKFNDTEKGLACKKILENHDITGLSIWANQLKQQAGNVLHGVINEVSLVLRGANPGAVIDFALSHADGSDGEVYAYLIGDEYTELRHDDDGVEFEEVEEDDMKKTISHAEEDKETSGKESESDEETIEEVFNTMTEKQKAAVYAMLAALDEDKGDDKDMKHNVFEGTNEENYLSHADMETIFRDAKRLGSLKDAVNEHLENGVLAHATTPDDWNISKGNGTQTYGFRDPDMLFPDYKAINNIPEWIKRDTGWVTQVMSSVKHTPFSRIKTLFADITEDDARAKGYIKGKLKKEEFFTLIKRTTDPQTIYKKQKMDRDDVIDITDFDVVSWLKGEMRLMLEEEIARAILVGDGRSTSSDDKIQESHVRPIISDSELFSVQVDVEEGGTDEVTAKNFIKAAIKYRKEYKGSGNPVLYTDEDMLTNMLLIEDGINHFLYPNESALATALRVSKIVTVPVMENVNVTIKGSGGTTSQQKLCGIIVNLNDYVIGADKGGAVAMFDDFDIDYNQQKYLIETRISGALVKPYSALVFSKKSSG